MLKDILAIAEKAGHAILSYRGKITPDLVDYKSDESPVTLADKESNRILTLGLQKIKSVPVLSEEEPIPYEERILWDEYWMIDPLDGTKELIKGQDDFCINITYMKNNIPVIGVIYAPVTGETHAAIKGKGTFHSNIFLEEKTAPSPVVAVSRYHHSKMTQDYLDENGYTSTFCVGAALKFGRMALGQIDIYPRFKGSSEWDIAAGHLILEERGASIIDLTTQNPPLYNKQSLENNFFIAKRA